MKVDEIPEGGDELGDIVTIYRAEIPEPHLLEEHARYEKVL